MIEAVLLFIHEEADNEYVPFASLNDAQARIEEYVENGYDPEYLGVYIEHSLCQKKKRRFLGSHHASRRTRCICAFACGCSARHETLIKQPRRPRGGRHQKTRRLSKICILLTTEKSISQRN